MVDLSLELATIEDILQEIKKRYNSCVIIYTGRGKKENTVFAGMDFSASITELLGLMEYGQKRAVDYYTEYVKDLSFEGD